MTSIIIPDSVTSIGQWAFANCTELSSIKIPESVTNIEIGFDAFKSTAWYNSQPDGIVYLGNSIYSYKGEMPNNTNLVLGGNAKNITGCAFLDCSGLASITIPKNISHICNSAFYGCNNLKVVSFEDGIDTLFMGSIEYGYSAVFSNCPIDSVYWGRNISWGRDYFE